jgi:hypothetical protein
LAYAEDCLKSYSLRRVYRFISIERTSFTKFQPSYLPQHQMRGKTAQPSAICALPASPLSR